jgi:membrane protease YdiL (CAAX protease family)
VVPETSPPLPLNDTPLREPMTRRRAMVEVLLCSGYPTQLLIGVLLASVGILPTPDGRLSATFLFANLAIDSVLLLALIWFFLREAGDDPRRLFLGSRPAHDEVRLGLLTVPLMLAIVIGIQLLVQTFAPSLRNVPESPFEDLLTSRWVLAGFVVMLVIAGGVREELQRAFLLHRFEHHLGGATVGLVLTSLTFGLGHTLQGWDAAIATAVLGAFWGALYLARRSAVATIASHGCFNIVQVIAGYSVITGA